MPTRRTVLSTALAAAGSQILPAARAATGWHMPDEGERHLRTWMAFGPSTAIWGRRLAAVAQDNLARIAQTIAAFEPVTMLVRPEDREIAAKKCGDKISLLNMPIDDLWIRDTGAVFVKSANETAAVSFNFNGWGNKQTHARDAEVAANIAAHEKVQRLTTKLVLEGGGLEVDGEGTALITESCVINANRNPGVSKAAIEAELMRLLGLTKIIWLPGIAGKDITDGHTDFYARFAAPGVVVVGLDPDPASFDYAVTLSHLDILRSATDSKGRKLKLVVLKAPESVRPAYESDDFAAGYINFYVCNGAVIAPQFGDKAADMAARDALRDLFPKREIIQLDIDAIAAGGGGIHCATQQQPE